MRNGNNETGIRRKPKFGISTLAIGIAVMLLGTTAISTLTATESVLAYRHSHATSQVNDCGNGELPLNVGCQNTGSQIQGDKNTIALSSQQTFPPPPPTTGTLIVIKVVECLAGAQCASLPDPSIFEMNVFAACPPEGGACNDFEIFPGESDPGTTVTIEQGDYFVMEDFPPSFPSDLEVVDIDASPGCSGTLEAGEEITCTVTNTLAPIP